MSMLDLLQNLSAAEELFDFFGLEYEPSVLNVNRLHILKRFNQYLGRESLDGMTKVHEIARGRTLLARAYSEFLVTKPAEAKLFKVFHDAEGVQNFGVDKLRASLPSRAVG
jgi:nitrogenase-stabilizing/protective protein